MSCLIQSCSYRKTVFSSFMWRSLIQSVTLMWITDWILCLSWLKENCTVKKFIQIECGSRSSRMYCGGKAFFECQHVTQSFSLFSYLATISSCWLGTLSGLYTSPWGHLCGIHKGGGTHSGKSLATLIWNNFIQWKVRQPPGRSKENRCLHMDYKTTPVKWCYDSLGQPAGQDRKSVV